jgi:mono/diheme cytochrome c family protein
MSSITPRLVYLCSALALGSVLVAADRSSAHSGPPPNIDVARALAVAHAGRSVWDSVYSDAQAKRGDSLYHVTCNKCHGDTLGGGTATTGEDSPPLAGATFLGNWYGVSVAELYDKIRNGMPPDNPKTIDPQVVVDVMAFLLNKNGFPAGAADLPNDVPKLKEIMIEKSKSP